MLYSHTHLLFHFLIAINKSSQNELGIATDLHTNFVPLTMKFKNNFIGKTKLHQSLSMWGLNKAKASSLNTANMKYLPWI